MPPRPLTKSGRWRRLAGEVFADYPLAPLTTWKIGGPAQFLAMPRDLEDVAELMAIAQAEAWPLFFLGRGSNVLISDRGLPGLTLYLARSFQQVEIQGNILRVGAGVALPRLAKVAAEAGLAGLEFLAGIPGTVGAAVRLNAGAYGSALGQYLQRVWVITPGKELKEIPVGELAPAYRYTRLLAHPQWLVVEAEIAVTETAAPEDIYRRQEELRRRRRASQPSHPRTCGSVFKNPPGGPPAWQLIEAAGWRGKTWKGAQVSRKHANFIINRGGATAAAMAELLEAIVESVWRISGIRLEREVIRLPEDIWP